MLVPVPGIGVEQQTVPVLRRIVLVAEAAGEPPSGMYAIDCVLRTRAKTTGGDLRAVILKHAAFSEFLATDPEYQRLTRLHVTDPCSWRLADAICQLVDEGLLFSDPTKGSNHYYNPDVAKPAWGRGSPGWDERWVRGKHVFGWCA